MRTLINIIELYIIFKFSWKLVRLLFTGRWGNKGRNSRHSQGIVLKLWSILTYDLNRKLDARLRKQKKQIEREKQEDPDVVVPFKKPKKKVN